MQRAVIEESPFIPIWLCRQRANDRVAVHTVNKQAPVGQKKRDRAYPGTYIQHPRIFWDTLKPFNNPWVIERVRIMARIEAKGFPRSIYQLPEEIGPARCRQRSLEILRRNVPRVAGWWGAQL